MKKHVYLFLMRFKMYHYQMVSLLAKHFKEFSIICSIPSTFSIHSTGIDCIPNLAPKQAPIKLDRAHNAPAQRIVSRIPSA